LKKIKVFDAKLEALNPLLAAFCAVTTHVVAMVDFKASKYLVPADGGSIEQPEPLTV
jgi:hypothetical protein